MNVGIVTSQVNYVKDNYEGLLCRLIEVHGSDIKVIVVIQTLDFNLLLKIFALPFMGAPRLSWILLKNSVRVLFRDPFQVIEKKGFFVIRTKSVNADSCYEQLKALDLDLLLNIRTRNIFKKRILELPKWGCLNVHHGLLPHYRGTMCDLWALSEQRPIGYSVHWMNSKIDDGRILRTREIRANTLDYSQIPYLSSREESEDLVDLLQEMKMKGKIEGVENRAADAIYTRNPTRNQISKMREKGIRL